VIVAGRGKSVRVRVMGVWVLGWSVGSRRGGEGVKRAGEKG
jgi:hypothetical protein